MYDIAYHSDSLEDKTILITGAAGFIGSNIVEYLLRHRVGKVIVLDNLLTGFKSNVDVFADFPNYQFIEGDIRNLETCKKACEGVDIICHQAALGSVPRSIKEPYATTGHNVDGFVNMVFAAKYHGIRRFVYASSSSVYGDEPNLPKVENRIGKPLSPYAITKLSNELFADNFAHVYDMEFIGFRYFNVFGPRQSSQGAYAAVIPLFVEACMKDGIAYINGDGGQTRDFTFIENVVQVNIKAMFTKNAAALNQVYNVGCGERYTILELFQGICNLAGKTEKKPLFQAAREGDIRDSQADISKVKKLLGYHPTIDLMKGLKLTLDYFKELT
ncbi:MAG: SDR family oxidoreductase [Saprospiraceae bacterium]|nr:SDR family oxidoreductase [Saprospiraceae bacterium]